MQLYEQEYQKTSIAIKGMYLRSNETPNIVFYSIFGIESIITL
jgi:hypothetical protein